MSKSLTASTWPFVAKLAKRLSFWYYQLSLVTAIFLCLALFSVAIGWMLYQNINDLAQNRVQLEGQRIGKKLTDIFHETYKVMLNIGQALDTEEPDNLRVVKEEITQSFGGIRQSNKTFIWPKFGWISSDNKTAFSTEEVTYSLEMADDYLKYGKQHPWELQFVNFSNEMNTRVVPITLGITNKDKVFLGSVIAAFPLSDLSKSIEAVIKDHSITFVLLDNEGKLLLQSRGKKISENRELMGDLHNLSGESVRSPTNIAFYYKNRVGQTPYTLITYLDREAIASTYYQVFLPRLMKFITAGICFLLLAYFLLHNLIKKIAHYLSQKNSLRRPLY